MTRTIDSEEQENYVLRQIHPTPSSDWDSSGAQIRRRRKEICTMLRQEEIAFIKALGSIELSPVFLRELRKAMAAGEKKKALVA
jgi:hypothetical protein